MITVNLSHPFHESYLIIRNILTAFSAPHYNNDCHYNNNYKDDICQELFAPRAPEKEIKETPFNSKGP